MAAGGRRSGSAILLLAILLIAGLGAVVFLFRDQIFPTTPTQESVQMTPTPQEKMVNIVITTQFVSRGTVLNKDVLTTVPYPEKDLVQGTFYTEIAQVEGKKAKYDLEARLPLTSSLVAGDSGSGPAFQIPKGMVAISIPISRLTAVSYAPQVGDHVNVIVSIMLTDVDANFQSRLPNNTASISAPAPGTEDKPPSLAVTIASGGDVSAQGRVEMDGVLGQAVYVVPAEIQRPRPVTQTLIQDAIVLHVGSFLDPTLQEPETSKDTQATPKPTEKPADAKNTNATPQAPKAPEDMTLIVSPQDAVTLNYLMLVGAKLSLVLRSAGDVDRVNTEAVTLQFLMDQYAIPNPAKLPYSLEPRVDKLEYPKLISPTATPQK